MMTLVTGAAGHLGNVLVRELVERGDAVRALALPGEDCTCLAGFGVEIIRGNTLDPGSLVPAFAGVGTVYHLAGIISIHPGRDALMRQVNVVGTANVLRAAREARVNRFVYVSSIHALARLPQGQTIDESSPFDPHNAAGEYDQTKAEASLLVLQEARRGMDAVIACPTGIIGPYDYRESEMGRLIRSFLGPGLHAIVHGGFDFVDVRDVAHGLVLMAEKGRRGEVYVLGGHYISFTDLLAEARRGATGRSSCLVVPHALAKAAAPVIAFTNRLAGRDPQFTRYSLDTVVGTTNISHAKATAELGWEPRPMCESIADTVRWWREHPLIVPVRRPARSRRTPAPVSGRARVAVVTGASSGIGALTARRLAREGFHVVLVARRRELLDEIAAGIRDAGGMADVVAVDLARPEGPQAVFDHVMERHRGLDVLVNNAGFGWYGYTSDMPWVTAQDMIQVNNAALVQLIMLFLPVMRRADQGHIINVSSVAGSIPSQGVALYSATKSFVDALTTSLYRETHGTGVHVSVVKPGAVLTEFYRTAERQPGGSTVPAERFGVSAETVVKAIMGLLRRPRRAVWVPGPLRILPWVEFSFGWIMDRIGPALLRRRSARI
jgi:dihydroflavonol-4-reductase